jgi:guanylate kinase
MKIQHNVNKMKMNKIKGGHIFVITAPSGAGKTTLCQALVNDTPTLRYTISYTTRQPRKGEVTGSHYHFVKKENFEGMVKQELFAEWAEVYGNYYGTLVKDIESLNRNGYDVLMDIDTKGAMQIKHKFKDAVLIFICPPSLSVLEKRLFERGTDSLDVVEKRLEKVYDELGYLSEFDYMIVNDELNRALNELKSIIIAEKLKVAYISPLWIDTFFKNMKK